MGKWANESAGPRVVKDVERALGKLMSEGRTHTELYGVKGGRESESALMEMFGPVRAEVQKLADELGEKYGWKVTKANAREVQAAATAALAEAVRSRPVVDNRRTPEEDAELTAASTARQSEWTAKQDAANALMDQVKAKAPAGAKGVIVAKLMVDDSDMMTDYFSNHAERVVAVGFRMTAREDFTALHRAAASFPETAGTDFSEHRDNHSMGKGNYLSDHGWDGSGSGWVVKSHTFPCPYVTLTEDATSAVQAAPGRPAAAPPADDTGTGSAPGGVTVSPGTKPGFVEVRFPSKPSAGVRQGLKNHGFRWSGYNGCWYGRDSQYAHELAVVSELTTA
jgi:hypothetical protein